MAKGTVDRIIPDKEYDFGFIKQDEGDDDVYFRTYWVEGVPKTQVSVGMRVEYEARRTSQGLQTKWVKAIVHQEQTPTEPKQMGYCFLNPYNFVRYLDNPTPEPTADSPEKLLMWRCPPPPHDRYVGLSGRITCKVKTITPLFISDSHAIGDENGHKTYRFFRYGGKPALPASSLRGMVRSVYEAATNSCFAVFDDRRLEFRERPEYGNKVKDGAGIVNELPDSDNEGEIVLCHIAKVGAYYEGDDQWKNVLGRKPDGQSWECGDWAVARAKSLRQGYVVRELSTAKDRLQPLGDGEKYIEGRLKITGKDEGTTKRSEFLFLNPDKHGCLGIVSFGTKEMKEYNSVLAGQREHEELPASPQSSKLSKGNLVWVETEGKGKHRRTKRIVRVQVPRIPYRHTIGELLPDFLHHCTNYDALCPACRVFGWVYQKEKGEEIPQDKVTAYAGRVRFSHGEAEERTLGYEDPKPLAILSTPKPTTTEFYLLNSNGEPGPDVDYDDESARLRGRKFYRHHGEASPQEYTRAPMDEPQKDNQNRTVRDALKPGAKFAFTVNFENLAPVELGALLYALELEDDLVHRLGYAKPLGFGSIKVTIDEVEMVDWPTRLQSLEADAGWQATDPEQIVDLKDKFLHAMRALYDGEFSKVLGDLCGLLSEPPDGLQVHYPRTDPKPDPEGKNYEWFVGNKKRIDSVTLDLASEDKRGLSLIDKDGRENRG